MKNIFYTLIFLTIASFAYGQQEHQFTQFMHNKLALNPAYAGVPNAPSLLALYRNQWMGFEGRPETKLVGFHTNIVPNKVGVGLTIANYEIGGTFSTWSGTMAYSYRIEFTEKIDLRLGLHGSIKYLGVDFDADRTIVIDPNDESILENSQLNDYNANFGFGGYLQLDKVYLGISVPNLFRNEIGITDVSGGAGEPLKIAREVEHFYLMTGARLPVSDQVSLQPNILAKYVSGAPFDLDANLTAVFNDRIGAGVSYRLGGEGNGESVDFLVYLKLKNLGIGAAYDFTLTEISDYSDGSLEVVVTYEFRKEQEGISNPRFFF
jgi:type IX secretion system PorP/SprF family membrane protein